MDTAQVDVGTEAAFYDAVEEVLSQILSKSPIYSHLFGPSDRSCLELLRTDASSTPGHLTFRFRSAPSEEIADGDGTKETVGDAADDTLQDHHLNSHQILHGSVSCTLVDLISGVCIASLGPEAASAAAAAAAAASPFNSPHIGSRISEKRIVYPTRQQIVSCPRGLSTDMSLQFTSSARKGDEVWVRTWVKKKGRRLVWVGVQVWARERGSAKGSEMKLVVEGSHTKYIK